MKHTHSHGFVPSTASHDYQVCEGCGSLHRFQNTVPDDVYASGYWDKPDHSTIREQVHNVAVHQNEVGLTKVRSVLQHAPGGTAALEIGCAPGSLLLALKDKYEKVVGIDYDSAYRADILDISQGAAALTFGSFPEVSQKWPAESYDLICAMDVLEHIEDGEAFMEEVLRLLKPDGTVIFMGPFLFGDGAFREGDLCPEHIWLYHRDFLTEWFGEMFLNVSFDRWIPGHELIVASNKKIPHETHAGTETEVLFSGEGRSSEMATKEGEEPPIKEHAGTKSESSSSEQKTQDGSIQEVSNIKGSKGKGGGEAKTPGGKRENKASVGES